MIVDDNLANLAHGKELLKSYYSTFSTSSAVHMFEILKNVTPDIILLDVDMPGMNGFEAIKTLKRNPKTSDIPVIFLTAKTDEDSELEGISLGAIDYVKKPFSAPLLLLRIENHLIIARQRKELKELNDELETKIIEKSGQIINLQASILKMVAELVDARDMCTGGHVARTQQYLGLLIWQMIEDGLYSEETKKWDMYFLMPSAQLHDVGKIAIDDSILKKSDKLTDEEFAIIKTHAAIGMDAIKRMEAGASDHIFLEYARAFAGYHHEKWDGTGYPCGLAGREIPLEGRLLAIVDVYDALVSERPYKKPFSPEKAREIILEGSGTHFEPAIVEIFDKVSGQFAELARKGHASGEFLLSV